MSRKTGRVRRAVNASSSDILDCLGENPSMCVANINIVATLADAELFLSPSIRVLRSSELTDEEKNAMWGLFEDNMHALYSDSSFGWKPAKRKKEIFHSLSRFLVVGDSEDENKILAFSMFRFENEEGENVVYCYDIQISSHYHRTGMGKKLIDLLCTIGKAFEMEKIVLTVLKTNTKALAFYRACGFQIDPNSPSEYLPADDPRKNDIDYEIMSKELEM